MSTSTFTGAKKQNIWISAAEAIANNIHLLTQILLRLPAKPLGKFKYVSKTWLSLISNPQFTHHHHHHTPTALLLKEAYGYDNNPEFEMVPLKQDDNTIPKAPSFDYLNAPSSLRIRQSCNGLLLCESNLYLASSQILYFYICNPTTKQFKRLSPPACKFQDSSVSVCMAFDPLKSNHYKLICVHTVTKTDNYHIDMYSSETDSWRPLEITFTLHNHIEFSDAVFCNGAVHWHSREETSLYFDVDTECFNTMPMPNLSQTQRLVGYFGESRGHLHLIVTEWPYSLQFDVLEMAADYSGWYVRYHVNLDAVRTAFPDLIWHHRIMPRFSVLDVIRAQKEEDSMVVVLVDKKPIYYNVHDGTSKTLYDLDYALIKDYSSHGTFRYFESLASV